MVEYPDFHQWRELQPHLSDGLARIAVADIAHGLLLERITQ
ncbi:hypothetical protein [Pseudomonas fluorescens]|nr:hypothetical protein [Pseudomonas fluorescens]